MVRILTILMALFMLMQHDATAQKKKKKDIEKSGKVPEWISRPGLYDDVIVAAGIGEGLNEKTAKAEADLDARKKIAEAIQTNVRSMTTNFIEEASQTDGVSSSSAAQEYFSEITQSLTNLTLQNVKIEEYYPPKGEKSGKKLKFYAKAVVGKADVENALKHQVSSDAASNKINGVKMSADKALAAMEKAIARWNSGDGEDVAVESGTGEEVKEEISTGGGMMSGGGSGMGSGQEKKISYGDWTKSLPNMPKRDGYYQGLGAVPVSGNQSEDASKAEGEARAMVIRAIRSEITSKVTNVMEETTKNGIGEYSESFNSVTESFSQETLKNLKIEFHVDKKAKKHYAYCEISIAEVERQFAERLKKAINVARTYFQAARAAENSGDYYLALTQYFEGAKEIVVAELINKEPIEGDIDGSGKSVSVRATFDTQLKTLLGKMRVEIAGGDAQKGVKGEPLATPLMARLVYDRGGSAVPVKNASLAAYSVQPTVVKVDDIAKTDGTGKASFTVHSVESVNPSGQNKIRVGINEKEFAAFTLHLPNAVAAAKNVFKDFSFSAKGSAITRIVILVFEENMGREQGVSIVEGDIVKQLVSNKFKVIDKSEVFKAVSKEQAKASAETSNDDVVSNALKSVADVLIIGSVKAVESEGGSTNPYGGSSNRKSAWASGSVRCIDLENSKIIATSEKQGIKGIQLSLEKAGIMALQALSKETSKEILDGLNAALK